MTWTSESMYKKWNRGVKFQHNTHTHIHIHTHYTSYVSSLIGLSCLSMVYLVDFIAINCLFDSWWDTHYIYVQYNYIFLKILQNKIKHHQYLKLACEYKNSNLWPSLAIELHRPTKIYNDKINDDEESTRIVGLQSFSHQIMNSYLEALINKLLLDIICRSISIKNSNWF